MSSAYQRPALIRESKPEHAEYQPAHSTRAAVISSDFRLALGFGGMGWPNRTENTAHVALAAHLPV